MTIEYWGKVRKIYLGQSKNKKLLIIFGLVVLSLAIFIIIFQIAYPSSRTLPMQKVGGINMGLKDRASINDYLVHTQDDMMLTIKANGKEEKIAWQDLGVIVDQDKVAKKALNYPFYQKVIPFSSAYKVFMSNTPIMPQFNDDKVNEYSEKISKDNHVDPANASISIDGTNVIRNSQKPGKEYKQDSVSKQIKDTPYEKNSVLNLASSNIEAEFSKEQIEEVAKRAESIIAKDRKIELEGKIIQIPALEVAGWLQFRETNDDQRIAMEINKDKLKAYLGELNKGVYKAPGEMTVVVSDGTEISRTADTSGKTIDINGGADVTADFILKNESDLMKLETVKVPPKIKYQKSYTKSQAGMSALLNDIASEEPDMAISVRALDGSGIVASGKGDKQYMAASTYKLSVAYSIVKRIEAGAMQWTEDVNGRNVDQCLADMIVVSDNPCPSAIGNKIGWQNITDESRALGMGGTNFARGFVSTPNDQTIFLSKLYQGSLMNPTHTDKLLNLMKQQKYRAGVPAGAAGSVVANKVGFIDGYLHDSAIVYGPKGVYAISIYSNKSSWAKLSKATSRVHELMSR